MRKFKPQPSKQDRFQRRASLMFWFDGKIISFAELNTKQWAEIHRSNNLIRKPRKK